MRLIPIAYDGWKFILPLVGLGGFLVFFGRPWTVGLGCVLFLLAVFCAFFFRDFERRTPIDPMAIFSPGDGRVLEAGVVSDEEDGDSCVIRIFLSVFDVHVQRSPVKGHVESIDYKKGRFLDARHERAHIDNEQNSVKIRSEKGTVVVKQIAGLVARRIVCWVKPGHNLEQGERYGLIRFGSQADLIMPDSVHVQVKKGDRVIGGETVLARWRS